MCKLKKRDAGYINQPGYSSGCNVEAMKLLLKDVCLQSDVKIRLHTQVVSAVREGSNRLSLVVTESKSGRQGQAGKLFVYATGEGELAI